MIGGSGWTWTFLRPNLYFQGLLAFQPMIATEGRFVAPIGDARVSAREAATISPHVRDVTGIEPRDFKTFSIDYAKAFGEGARHGMVNPLHLRWRF